MEDCADLTTKELVATYLENKLTMNLSDDLIRRLDFRYIQVVDADVLRTHEYKTKTVNYIHTEVIE